MTSDPFQRGKLRVLIVDDDADTVQTTAVLVRLWGHEARVACDAAQALAEAGTFQPDAALLDLAMPGLDGYGLAEQLREQAGARPLALFAVTGLARETDRLRCQQSGFTHYLIKPVDPSRLERILRHLAGQLIPTGALPMHGAEYVSSARDQAGRRRWGLAELAGRSDPVLIVRHSVAMAQQTCRRADETCDRSIVLGCQTVALLRRAEDALRRSKVLGDQTVAACRYGKELVAQSHLLLAG
jgi:CheY-like chemotaxis protein